MKHRLTAPFLTSIALAFVALAFIASPALADSDDGEKLFKRKCASCHKMDKHGVGPMLQGVIGRKAGSTDFSKYVALKDADFMWDETNLDAWIADPKKFIGKSTPMSGKVKDEGERKTIIDYLKSEND